MAPKLWWILVIVAMVALPWVWLSLETQRLDFGTLPPPAAGRLSTAPDMPYSCDNVVFSLSKDGIKYVRESGGGTLLAAELDNAIAFYQLSSYGELYPVDDAETDTESTKRLVEALLHCDAAYTPSGVSFASR